MNKMEVLPDEAIFNPDGVIFGNFDLGDTMWNSDDVILPNGEVPDVMKQFIPEMPLGPPARESFEGDFKFGVEICSSDTDKSKYLYSHQLNRIYVDMDYSFPVRFKWSPVCGAGAKAPTPLFVRATVVFSAHEQAGKRVARCLQHYHDQAKNSAEMSEAMRHGVLQSTREAGAQDVFYCGTPEARDSWLSVVVRLAAPGAHAYQFVCKSSCSTGINRRNIAIIYTLEDYTGLVLGRQSVGARVCSCPRRDMKRDLQLAAAATPATTPTATPATPATPTTPKQRKRPITAVSVDEDDHKIMLPQVAVVGKRACVTGLRVMLSVMEEKRAARARQQLPAADLDGSIAHLRREIDRIDKL